MGWTLFIVSSTTRRTSFSPLKGPMTDTVLPCTRIYVCVRSSNAFSAAGSQHPFQAQCRGVARTCAVLSQYPLSSLDEALLVPHHAPDLDDVACHGVLENLDGLGRRHGASKKLDQIARIEDGGGVERLDIPLAM
jgi:hypothetical protein